MDFCQHWVDGCSKTPAEDEDIQVVQHIFGHAHVFKDKQQEFCVAYFFQQLRDPGLFPLTLLSAQEPFKAPRKKSFLDESDTSHLVVLKTEGMNTLCHANDSFMILCAVMNWLRLAPMYNDLGSIIYLSDSDMDVIIIGTYKEISVFYQFQGLLNSCSSFFLTT